MSCPCIVISNQLLATSGWFSLSHEFHGYSMQSKITQPLFCCAFSEDVICNLPLLFETCVQSREQSGQVFMTFLFAHVYVWVFHFVMKLQSGCRTLQAASGHAHAISSVISCWQPLAGSLFHSDFCVCISFIHSYLCIVFHSNIYRCPRNRSWMSGTRSAPELE